MEQKDIIDNKGDNPTPKTFTQEQVNEIVEKRLLREQKKNSSNDTTIADLKQQIESLNESFKKQTENSNKALYGDNYEKAKPYIDRGFSQAEINKMLDIKPNEIAFKNINNNDIKPSKKDNDTKKSSNESKTREDYKKEAKAGVLSKEQEELIASFEKQNKPY